jgi:hypothetical protein
MGPAGGAESVAPHKGLTTACGVCASTAGIGTRSGEVVPGFLVELGARDHREIAGARQAGQLSSISAVRCAPITGLCGHEGWRHHHLLDRVALGRVDDDISAKPSG